MELFKFFFLSFFLMGAASSQAASLWEKLSSKEKYTWERLLHFYQGESRVDDELFFVHSEGKHRLDLELEAFISEYKNPTKAWGRFKAPLPCAFPARVSFLKAIGLIQTKAEICPGWKKWQKEIDPRSISIVFSTAYPNNPASMFGHTFIRFTSGGERKKLLEYSVNYSAIIDGNDHGAIYALKGLFGGYRGYFDLHPYYIFVNDYVHSENRDLIEYDLNLSQEQVSFLFAHLWELYQAGSFDYYFTWENCSFHLAEFLDVAFEKPLSVPSRWYYLPVDLIHALKKRKGLVTEIRDRPSKKREFETFLKDRSRDEVGRIQRAFSGEIAPKDLTRLELEGLIGYLNYYKFQNKGAMGPEKVKLFRKTLLARAKIGGAPKKVDYSPFETRPHYAHQAQRFSVGALSRKDQNGLRLHYRSGYHELLSPDEGLDSFSQFKFLSPTISLSEVNDDFKVVLDEFSLIEIASLHPQRFFDSQLSWKVGGRYERFLNENICFTCGRFLFEGKMGLTFGNREKIVSFLGGIVAEYSGRLEDSYRASPAYEFLSGMTWSHFKTILQFEGRFDTRDVKERFDHRLNLGLGLYQTVDSTFRLSFKNLWQGKSWRQAGHEFSFEWGRAF